MKHIFTIDVEDWYHGFPPEYDLRWERSPRLEYGMNFLLDLLEDYEIQATFFWLASEAGKYPSLLQETCARGHEIGCHGLKHNPIYVQDKKTFYSDTKQAIEILSGYTGVPINSYRAPYFSLTQDTWWALDILASLGITHDSSLLPMRHWRTGMPRASDRIQEIRTSNGVITEVPITTRNWWNLRLPIAGGGYFRAYHYALIRQNIQYCERQGKPMVFYIHPWEFDPQHPKISRGGLVRFMHYLGIGSSRDKLKKLLSEYSFGALINLTATYDSLLHDFLHPV